MDDHQMQDHRRSVALFARMENSSPHFLPSFWLSDFMVMMMKMMKMQRGTDVTPSLPDVLRDAATGTDHLPLHLYCPLGRNACVSHVCMSQYMYAFNVRCEGSSLCECI
jgi:hypothetical protein